MPESLVSPSVTENFRGDSGPHFPEDLTINIDMHLFCLSGPACVTLPVPTDSQLPGGFRVQIWGNIPVVH